MKEQLVKNEYYELHIDRDKNRIYTIMRGYWPSLDVVPNLEEDFLTAPRILQPDYTSLIDVREFKVPGQDVINMFINIENENSKNYVRKKAARVVTQPLEKLAADRVGKESGVKEHTAFFNTVDDAEAWLDE